MKRSQGWRAALFVSGGLAAVMLGGFFASPASGHDAGTFQDKDYKVTPVPPTPSYDSQTNRTTFTFTLEGTEAASHVTIVPCGSPTLVSATGPSEAGQPSTGPDPSTEHAGTKFPKGATGEYTIVYEGNVPGLDVIVKNGPGHKHFAVGTCTTETTTPSTPTEQTPPNNNPPSDNPQSNPASNQPGQSGTEVAGAPLSKPGSDVLGNQLTAPESQASLPRTGLPLPALAPIGMTLVALGGVASALGRRPRG